MKYSAVIKKTDEWWIGWLIDLPGVNAQEKTKAGLIESLRVGAEDMLDTEVPFEPGTEMTTVDISDPVWTKSPIENLTAS
jgi:predicted RNase H-like HicB family nuclease